MTFADLDRPPLDPTALTEALTRGATVWRDVRLLEKAPSTNALAAEAARAGAGEGLVVVADHQTAGRGRLDRAWTTPPGTALTFSLVLAPDGVPLRRWPWLPLLTGIAVAEGVRRATGVEAVLKWPNDVLVEEPDPGIGPGRKLAGILVERVDRPTGAIAVVGVGINVGARAEELPVSTATSLLLAGAGGRAPDRTVVLREVLRTFEALYLQWHAEQGDPARGLHASYVRRCASLGREVHVDLPDGSTFAGRAEAVDADGALVVASGADRRTFHAGDVVHARRPR